MSARLFAAVCLLASLFFGTRAWASDAPEGESTPTPNASAEALAADAEAARAAGLYERCMEKDTEAIELDAKSTMTRVHLAGCADRAGKVLLALEQLRVVLDTAIETKNGELADLTRQRVEQLLKRLGALTVDPPPAATELTVTIDDVILANEQLKKPLSIDPGSHRIHAEGMLEGTPSTFDQVVSVADGERLTVSITLTPKAAEHLTPGQLACMQAARNDDEAFRCLPGRNKPLIVRAALEWSTYADSFDVLVLNPAVRANVSSPTRGWSFGASYLVDVISAASPDFVSTASPRGHDTRHAVSANGGYKPGRVGAEANASFSTEADYISRSGGLAVLADLFDKRVTPRLGWNISYDTISRGGTPTDVFHNNLTTNEAVVSASFVLSPRTVLIVGATGGFERGDQSKPYRLIPMFGPNVDVPAGAKVNDVNANRLPIRPYEQLPKERDRYAGGVRVIRRMGSWSSLRLEERLYTDTWENRATTTDVRWLIDTSDRFTFGPHARFHWQTGASFFERVYRADVTAGQISLPAFRTTDRELGPFYAVTGGASFWWKLTEPNDESATGSSMSWTLFASGDALYSRYTSSLYVGSRIAGYGTVGIEAVFE